MPVKVLARRMSVPVSNKIRWLAGATGCLTVVPFSVAHGLVFAVVPAFLIVGAALAGRFPRNGRDLIWFGAGALSVFGFPVGIMLLVNSLLPGRDVRVLAVAAASVFLVVWCDVAVVMEAVKTRRSKHIGITIPDPGSS